MIKRVNKAGLFLIVVTFGVVGALFMLNQTNSPKSTSQIASKQKASPTPTSVPSPDPKSSPTSSQSSLKTQVTSATIATSKGDIKIELYPEVAPKTVDNFVKKAQNGFYTNLTFHRVEDWVIQGGDPLGNGTGGGSIPIEFNTKPFGIGSLGVASRGDGKTQNDAQFFITKTQAEWLNGKYTNFGIVTKGIDIVNTIQIGDKILKITTE